MLKPGPSEDIFDVVVIGGGPGGYSAAIRTAQLGGKVGLVESKSLGGVCLNEGCIPTKFLLGFAETLRSIQNAHQLGITVGEVSINSKALYTKKNIVIKKIISGINFLMKKHDITVFTGEGAILEEGVVEVYSKTGERVLVNTKNIVIATGSESIRPPIPGVDGAKIITSDQALELTHVPKNMVIIGGGPEGVEFADIFESMGCKVTVVEMMSQLLPTQDKEVASELQRILSRKGVDIFLNSRVTAIEDSNGCKAVSFNSNDGIRKVVTEIVLLAVGRKPNVLDIGLEKIGLDFDSNIGVDEHMMTNVKGVYAVGDVVGKYLLAYTAFMEGEVAAECAMGKNVSVNYKTIPITIFTSPEVASVGLTEDQARQSEFGVKVGKFPFRASGKAVSMGHPDGFVKVVADSRSDKLLGVHIIGHSATELIHEATLALRLDAKVEDIVSTPHAHPTLSEAFKEAALDIRDLSIHKG